MLFKKRIMQEPFEEWYDKIHSLLSYELPGEEAQYKMAPSGRRGAKINPENPPRKAAVLLPVFFDEKGQAQLLLILRKKYDGVHSGQVSFPGGKFDPGETDPVAVALRETMEEVGIGQDNVLVAGKLTPLFIPPSNMYVEPVVGILKKVHDWQPHPLEVESIIVAPLRNIFDRNLISEITHEYPGNLILTAPCYTIYGHKVWGATAMILCEFSEVLSKAGFNTASDGE